jgi:TRAP-type C4-dicarboxylate transport system substrate-binding protein
MFASLACAQGPTLKYRVADSYGIKQPSGVALEYFVKRVAELSKGSMQGKVYHNGKLYSEEKSLGAVRDGTLELGFASLSNWGPYTKALRPIEAPFLYDNREQFRRQMLSGGQTRQLVAQDLEKDGFYPLMVFETGGARILGTNRRVLLPKDLAGLKIRVPQSPVPMDFWNDAGATATVVPWSETYLALASHTVDGLDTSLATYPLTKLWEVTKYILNLQYSSVASVVAPSTKWWNGLTQDQRSIMLKAAKEAEQVAVRAEDKESADLAQVVATHGVQLHEPTAQEMAQWRAVGQKLWDNMPGVPKSRIEEFRKLAESSTKSNVAEGHGITNPVR